MQGNAEIGLVPATFETIAADEVGAEAIASALGVQPPASWPPEFNGPNTWRFSKKLLTDHADDPGFGTYYIVADQRLVGTCGFSGPPGEAGTIEIGYSIVPADQRKGYGLAGVWQLMAWAFADRRVTTITAETVPALIASQGLLRRLGFELTSSRHHDKAGGILTFTITRRQFLGA